jgi:hypothetical protein
MYTVAIWAGRGLWVVLDGKKHVVGTRVRFEVLPQPRPRVYRARSLKRIPRKGLHRRKSHTIDYFERKMTNEAQILEVPMPECERIRLLEEATNWWLDLQDYKWDVAGQLNERQCRDAKKIDGRIDQLFTQVNELKCECCPEYFDRAS